MIPEDDVDRQLRTRKQQTDEDNSAEIEIASFKKFHMEVNALARVSSGWYNMYRGSKFIFLELRRLKLTGLKVHI